MIVRSYPYDAMSPGPVTPVSASMESQRKHSHGHLWGGIIIALSVILLGASFYIFYRRKLLPFIRMRKMKGSNVEDEKITLRRFQMEEIVKATNNFSQECLLGSGAFGNVYKGNFDMEGILAIKRSHANSYQSIEEFRNEVRLISKVKHRNLLGLVGYCEEKGEKGAKMLVYEYVPNGSLLEYINGKRELVLTWRQRVNLAIGAAKGITHLHEGVEPSIIHRDIKPSNILIGDDFEAKVSDFGLSRIGPIGDQSHVSSQVKGTPGYIDPAYCSSFHLTPFTDVYSFGVILMQLVAARPALYTGTNNSNNHIIEWARPSLERGSVEEILDPNILSESCNMETMLKMGQLGLRCVEKSPKQRPTMTQVWQELESALHSNDSFIPIDPARNFRRSSSGLSRPSTYNRDRKNGPQSFVSIDGVGYQRFFIDLDSLSFQSSSLRCLEADSISIDTDAGNSRGLVEETSTNDHAS